MGDREVIMTEPDDLASALITLPIESHYGSPSEPRCPNDT
jgi:hypothetical protein